MSEDFVAAMRRATEAVRGLKVADATEIVQRALGIGGPAAETPRVEMPRARPAGRPPLREVVRTLSEGRQRLLRRALDEGLRPAPEPAVEPGAEFRQETFACAAGSRRYRLYVPASLAGEPAGLVVMLHGCTQTPEDFATGTAMNRLAETHRLLVAYPEQTRSHNPMACWNWFRPGDQQRDSGEPAVLAGLSQAVADEFQVPADRVFAAGLSAGGAMAAVLAATYPELFAAVGVHSGLPYGAANDVTSAFATMRGERDGAPAAARTGGPVPRMIVFQGSADRTVHPSNATRLAAAAGAGPEMRVEQGEAAGRSYVRSIVGGANGAAALECWMVEGADHAWSGGDPAGSYADQAGPDASAEMVRFFLEGRRKGFSRRLLRGRRAPRRSAPRGSRR